MNKRSTNFLIRGAISKIVGTVTTYSNPQDFIQIFKKLGLNPIFTRITVKDMMSVVAIPIINANAILFFFFALGYAGSILFLTCQTLLNLHHDTVRHKVRKFRVEPILKAYHFFSISIQEMFDPQFGDDLRMHWFSFMKIG